MSARESLGNSQDGSKQLDSLRQAVARIDAKYAQEALFGQALSDGPAAQHAATAEPAQTSPRDPDQVQAGETAQLDDQLPCEGLVPPGSTLPAEDVVQSADYRKAKSRAMNILAMRDHSAQELREKLLRKDHAPAVVDHLIDKLWAAKLLDDEAYAARYVRAHRQRRKLSKTALSRELVKKGVAADTVAHTVELIGDETELIREVAAKKAASTRGLPEQTRHRRIIGMLARRGFPSGLSLQVTREVLAAEEAAGSEH